MKLNTPLRWHKGRIYGPDNLPLRPSEQEEIILRVNAHDALLAALQKIHSAELIPGLYHGGETYYGLNQRIKGIAEAAIAAGEGTP